MKNPLRPHTLLWKIMLSTSVAITLLFAANRLDRREQRNARYLRERQARGSGQLPGLSVPVESASRPAGFGHLHSQRHVGRAGGVQHGGRGNHPRYRFGALGKGIR